MSAPVGEFLIPGLALCWIVCALRSLWRTSKQWSRQTPGDDSPEYCSECGAPFDPSDYFNPNPDEDWCPIDPDDNESWTQ